MLRRSLTIVVVAATTLLASTIQPKEAELQAIQFMIRMLTKEYYASVSPARKDAIIRDIKRYRANLAELKRG